MLKQAIQKVVNGSNLTEQEMEAAMEVIMTGQATPAQIGSFITALRLKGETIEEITGAARVMRQKATRIQADEASVSIDREEINLDLETVVDTCGTGGDGTNTFTIHGKILGAGTGNDKFGTLIREQAYRQAVFFHAAFKTHISNINYRRETPIAGDICNYLPLLRVGADTTGIVAACVK